MLLQSIANSHFLPGEARRRTGVCVSGDTIVSEGFAEAKKQLTKVEQPKRTSLDVIPRKKVVAVSCVNLKLVDDEVSISTTRVIVGVRSSNQNVAN